MMRYVSRGSLIMLTLGLLLASLIVMGMPDLEELWSRALINVQVIQRDLHQQLSDAMRLVRTEGYTASWTLIGLSFLYGVFHAAGPGHGKVVISTYLLTQESQLQRGLVLSFVASIFQGVVAVAAVAATVGILDLSLRQAQGVAANLETLSYGVLALVGLVIMTSRIRSILRGRRMRAPSHEHRTTGVQTHQHHHHADDGCGGCGHSHGPSIKDLDEPLSWRGLVGMVASIGLRPCSGAVLVLLVAYALDLRLVGVAAVFAMSLGTAITVSSLAILSVYARKASLRLAASLPNGSSGTHTIVNVVGFLGGGFIFLVGALLLHAAWNTSAHPFL